MFQLTLSFITFEASEYIHAYSSIALNFPAHGAIEKIIHVAALQINPYKETSDFVRLAFELLYVVLLLYNIFLFFKKVKVKSI